MIEFNYGLYDRYTNIEYNLPADWDDAPPIPRVVSFRASVRMQKTEVQANGKTERKTRLIPIIEAETTSELFINRTSDLKNKLSIVWHRSLISTKDSQNREDKDFSIRYKDWEIEVGSDEFGDKDNYAEFWFSFSAPSATEILNNADENKQRWVDFVLADIKRNYELIDIKHRTEECRWL